MARQSGERTSTGTSHPDQQGVSSRGLEDSTDFGDVVDGVSEKDEIHLFVGGQVVVAQLVLEHLVEILRIIDLDVVFVLIGEIPEQKVSNVLLGPIELQILFDFVLELGKEVGSVLVVYQTVVEDTVDFVQPQLGEVFFGGQVVIFDLENATLKRYPWKTLATSLRLKV